MANLKEIRAKVASIKSTQKITRAMQMVAASKMRRAQERMAQGRPYAENMHRVIAHLVQANPEYKHRYICLLYTSPSPRDRTRSRMPSSA